MYRSSHKLIGSHELHKVDTVSQCFAEPSQQLQDLHAVWHDRPGGCWPGATPFDGWSCLSRWNMDAWLEPSDFHLETSAKETDGDLA